MLTVSPVHEQLPIYSLECDIELAVISFSPVMNRPRYIIHYCICTEVEI